MSNSILFYLHALSPLHMGTGAAVGAIDLPHSREVSTGLPNAPGSGIKGVWRDEGRALPNHEVLFGSDWAASTNRDQGALLFSDAWLLCLPVKSYVGDFAWASSPLALARYARERTFCVPNAPPPKVPLLPEGRALVSQDSKLVNGGQIYLHDVSSPTDVSELAGQWAALIGADVFSRNTEEDKFFKQAFLERFVVVSDADLVYLSEVSTDIRMRNSLDENKLVKKGALWSEENMPCESIFWGSVAADTIVTADNIRHTARQSLDSFGGLASNKTLQLGGKASVGRGVTRFIVAGGPT